MLKGWQGTLRNFAANQFGFALELGGKYCSGVMMGLGRHLFGRIARSPSVRLVKECPIILHGMAVQHEILSRLKPRIQKLGRPPGLAVVLAGARSGI